MIIRKILNNNVIVTENAAGREIVAMGRGIAFKRRVGRSKVLVGEINAVGVGRQFDSVDLQSIEGIIDLR